MTSSLKSDINRLLNIPDSLSERFHEKTKLRKFSKDFLDSKKWPETWKTIYFKGYPRQEELILPEPEIIRRKFFYDVFINRKSFREFSGKPISLKQISTLLYYSAGFKKRKQRDSIHRFYPSAGARYPLEVYIMSLNAELPCGIYHYYLKSHSLEKLLEIDEINISKYFDQKWVNKSTCVILITSVLQRTTSKYGPRGYRHVLIETGHLGQNFYLISTAMSLNCCAIGGFLDNKLNELLDIDGINETVIYALAIGNKIISEKASK